MTISNKVKITKYILGSLLPKNRLFELQVKQPKNFWVICAHLNLQLTIGMLLVYSLLDQVHQHQNTLVFAWYCYMESIFTQALYV